jgi:hypothetical protein
MLSATGQYIDFFNIAYKNIDMPFLNMLIERFLRVFGGRHFTDQVYWIIIIKGRTNYYHLGYIEGIETMDK